MVTRYFASASCAVLTANDGRQGSTFARRQLRRIAETRDTPYASARDAARRCVQ